MQAFYGLFRKQTNCSKFSHKSDSVYQNIMHFNSDGNGFKLYENDIRQVKNILLKISNLGLGQESGYSGFGKYQMKCLKQPLVVIFLCKGFRNLLK